MTLILQTNIQYFTNRYSQIATSVSLLSELYFDGDQMLSLWMSTFSEMKVTYTPSFTSINCLRYQDIGFFVLLFMHITVTVIF